MVMMESNTGKFLKSIGLRIGLDQNIFVIYFYCCRQIGDQNKNNLNINIYIYVLLKRMPVLALI